MTIDVSVIICARNEQSRISRQLDALDAQIEHPRFEVIVVDNGSTDRTADVVRKWIERPDHAHLRARLIDGSGARGIPAARNLGAREAAGRVIAFCDADDRVHPEWVGAFARAVGPDQFAGGLTRAHTTEGTFRPEVFGPGLIATPYLPHVSNCNCAIDRDAFFSLGGYDESLPAYGFEDVDISWRWQESGRPLLFVPEAVVDFTVSDSAASIRKKLALGRGRVLMGLRFPQYDPRRATVLGTSVDLIRYSGAFLGATLRGRRPDRAGVGRIVAAAGRVSGAVSYRRGAPPRALLVDGDDEKAEPSRPLPQHPRTRVAIAANNSQMGGGEVMLLQIARALREMGIEPLVVGPIAPGRPTDGVIAHACAHGFETVPLTAGNRPAYLRELGRWRRAHRDIALWCNGLVPTVATAGGGPRIIHLHQQPSPAQAIALALARIGARCLLVPSRFTANAVPGAGVFPNWTRSLPFRPAPLPAQGPLRIGFLGRLTLDKGVDVLAHAVGRLSERNHRPLQLVLAGESRFAAAADEATIAAALRPLGERVEHRGWMAPEDFFADVDLAVFPSRAPETFGLVVAEAMASGTPFVISDAGALPEVAGPEHPWIARAGDAEALADVIERALADLSSGADPMLRGARERWETMYSPHAGARRTARLLTSLPIDAPQESP